jgi:hypothetical protein
MALYYHLPLYKDIYALLLKIFECTKEFSREYKYSLGQDMKRDAMKLVQGIYRANKAKEKLPYIEYLMDDFELVKLQLRLCHDMKIVSTAQHAQIAEQTEKIGKQLQGWYNSVGKHNAK